MIKHLHVNTAYTITILLLLHISPVHIHSIAALTNEAHIDDDVMLKLSAVV